MRARTIWPPTPSTTRPGRAVKDTEGGRRLTPKPGAGPLWARYYAATANTPVFGDRDKTIHDDVNELTSRTAQRLRLVQHQPKKGAGRLRRLEKGPSSR
jgi:hypothetical protein